MLPSIIFTVSQLLPVKSLYGLCTYSLCIVVDNDCRRQSLDIPSTLLKSLLYLAYSHDLLAHYALSFIIRLLSLSETGWWRSCRSVPGRIRAPAQTQASPSCWHLQVRRRTRCSECRREGWAGGWSAPDAWTHSSKQFNEMKWDTNQSHFQCGFPAAGQWNGRWCKCCTPDAILWHILPLYSCLNI